MTLVKEIVTTILNAKEAVFVAETIVTYQGQILLVLMIAAGIQAMVRFWNLVKLLQYFPQM